MASISNTHTYKEDTNWYFLKLASDELCRRTVLPYSYAAPWPSHLYIEIKIKVKVKGEVN
jgi:hypothetical protein